VHIESAPVAPAVVIYGRDRQRGVVVPLRGGACFADGSSRAARFDEPIAGRGARGCARSCRTPRPRGATVAPAWRASAAFPETPCFPGDRDFEQCPGTELNRRHEDFQSRAHAT
jgi:hypothetical protein